MTLVELIEKLQEILAARGGMDVDVSLMTFNDDMADWDECVDFHVVDQGAFVIIESNEEKL